MLDDRDEIFTRSFTARLRRQSVRKLRKRIVAQTARAIEAYTGHDSSRARPGLGVGSARVQKISVVTLLAVLTKTAQWRLWVCAVGIFGPCNLDQGGQPGVSERHVLP